MTLCQEFWIQPQNNKYRDPDKITHQDHREQTTTTQMLNPGWSGVPGCAFEKAQASWK
jgi:hypothetical protein